MKKLILLIFLMSIVFMGMAQKPSASFLRPVPDQLFRNDASINARDLNQSVWLLRPTVGILATRNSYDKIAKQWSTAPLSAAGLGVGYQHFVEMPDGTPFNNFGVNLLLLTTVKLAEEQQSSMGVGLFGTFLGFINVGVDYQFGLKNFGIDTGVTVKF